MSLYWLVTAPAEGSKEKTFNTHAAALPECQNKLLNLPDLKVGTLDSLLALTDDLVRTDQYCESVVHKIQRDLKEQLPPDEDILVNKMVVTKYVETFTWDDAKYSVHSPLKDLADYIYESVSKLDGTVKAQLTEFNSVKSAISGIERKEMNNLLSKSLVGIVKKEHYIETENLQTLFVVVPKYNAKEFISKYETLTQFVVPRSACNIVEDENYTLFGVVVFKRVADEFGHKIRELKWTIRDYKFDPAAEGDSKKEKAHLANEKTRIHAGLVRYCKTAHSEVFIHWMHLKAIRLFVESVLRYGLPANFATILMKPGKNEKRARDGLKRLYAHIGSGMAMAGDDSANDAAMGGEFYPYVYLPLKATAAASA